MNLKLLLIICLNLYAAQTADSQDSSKRLVCFYDAISGKYQGEPFFFAKKSLPQALTRCTHLVYSFAEIPPQSFKLRKFPISPKPGVVKKKFPHLKVYLSVGGDEPRQTLQYMQLLQAAESKQIHFANYAKTILKYHSFDGLDLALPFPSHEPHKELSRFETAFKKLKGVFSGDENVQVKATQELKLQYSRFVKILSNQLAKANLKLSMTVLSNVNSSSYFDVFKIHTNFEFINLFAFDFRTPARNPNEADFSAPIYFKKEANRYPHENIDFQVNHWINNGCPANKLNLGIATYGRAWRLTIDSGLSGEPVVEKANGAADPGKYSKTAGLLSWPEICAKLMTKGLLRKVIDKDKKYGNYAFNPADKNDKNGIWISFDNPDFAGIKSEYVKEKLMGGVAIFNLQNDDFLKLCQGPIFPILTRVSKVLQISHELPRVCAF